MPRRGWGSAGHPAALMSARVTVAASCLRCPGAGSAEQPRGPRRGGRL